MSRSQLNLSIAIVLATLMAMLAVRGGAMAQPSPINAPGFNVLIVAETDYEKVRLLPKGQQDILGSTIWKETVKELGGHWRQLDPTHDHPNDDPKWTEAAKLPDGTKLPYYKIGNGTTGEQGTLPLSMEEWQSKIRSYGGQP